ncbi:unnamed protein product [Parnassius apollo]|uniref:(apollo) hypothetical protein n=1 Tax=Parnassius apollo TaxID=110799 RepID=A0A8S3XB14_PARAO|nr:unnamed protein product [Parnassius apollo]
MVYEYDLEKIECEIQDTEEQMKELETKGHREENLRIESDERNGQNVEKQMAFEHLFNLRIVLHESRRTKLVHPCEILLYVAFGYGFVALSQCFHEVLPGDGQVQFFLGKLFDLLRL